MLTGLRAWVSRHHPSKPCASLALRFTFCPWCTSFISESTPCTTLCLFSMHLSYTSCHLLVSIDFFLSNVSSLAFSCTCLVKPCFESSFLYNGGTKGSKKRVARNEYLECTLGSRELDDH
jgi:hypothetical protein